VEWRFSYLLNDAHALKVGLALLVAILFAEHPRSLMAACGVTPAQTEQKRASIRRDSG
jgi:hypothetical protein